MDCGAANQVTLQSQPADLQTSGASQERGALAKAVRLINQSGMWPGRDLAFHVDPATHHFTVEVLNSETGEVLEQIPSEEVLRIAAELSSKDPKP
jgi:flagellar protein FlaG